jgi:two-component system response regulator YesN
MFLACINEFFRETESLSPVALYQLFDHIAGIFYDVLDNSFGKFEKNEFIRSDISFGMQNALSSDELKDSICIPVCEALEYLNESIKLQDNKPIRLAKQYIQEHYSEQIKLEDVANKVYLSPSYFSNIFKKETGQNFTDFLVDYRMQEAKELLRNADLSVNEIADRVGYVEQRYFSKLFKKVVGIKPTEYRKLYS